jgi:hypothetical protein
MKPTPLGKTYLEYEAEVKEYNLSKVEKVELALIDDLKEGDKFYKVALDMAMSVNDEIENLSSMMNAVKAAASTAEDKYKVLAKIEKHKTTISYFGKQKSNLTLAKVDEEKRMLISPALIPNKNIVRYDANTDSEYYVWFSKETVRKASELYLKHNNHHKATYEHQDRVSGVLTIESWIKEGDMDKSKLYGFDLPNGSWFVKMKIDNEELWQDIKSKKIKGLSIEGYFYRQI